MRRFVMALAALAALAAPLASAQPGAPKPPTREQLRVMQATLQAVLVDPARTTDRARDRWRHPLETLGFFRVEPGMTVVDYMPSGGWYTRILVPYLGEQGHYIGLNPDVRQGTERQQSSYGNMAATFPAKAAEWTGVPPSRIQAYNTDTLPDSLKGTVDRVLVFREVHNMLRFGWLYRDLMAMRGLLKPGGLLGIVQHRARANAPADYANGTMGYLREKDVIALIEAHGFELVSKSEINANRADPADHPAGVWSLPPNLSQGETDRARYEAIGESDRMTLLFRKRP